MAYVPVCSFGPHFWPKKKHLYYVGAGAKGDYRRYRLRFCPEHVLVVEQYLTKLEAPPPDAALTTGHLPRVDCLTCGKPVDGVGWQLFITGYPTNDQRKDYWSELHIDCSPPDYLKNFFDEANRQT